MGSHHIIPMINVDIFFTSKEYIIHKVEVVVEK